MFSLLFIYAILISTNKEYCICKSGQMDADNDPKTGCELTVDEDTCFYGTCSDHGVGQVGEKCSNGWGELLICQEHENNMCCTINDITTITDPELNAESNCLQDKLDTYCRNLGADDLVDIVGEHSNCNENRFARFDGEKWRCYAKLKSQDESSIESCVSAHGSLIKCQEPDPDFGYCTRNQIIQNMIAFGCEGKFE